NTSASRWGSRMCATSSPTWTRRCRSRKRRSAMAAPLFDSSDSGRSGRPLAHVQSVPFDEPFQLELGGRLPGVTVAYETYGRLNAARDNAVLACHAISGDSHVAQHDPTDDPG